MDKARAGQDSRELWRRWLLPGLSLLVFAGVAFALHRELEQFRLSNVLLHLRAIPASAIGPLSHVSIWVIAALTFDSKPLPVKVEAKVGTSRAGAA